MYHGWKVVACAFLIAVFGWRVGGHRLVPRRGRTDRVHRKRVRALRPAPRGAGRRVGDGGCGERRRGLAISIAFNGAAVGGVLLVPALVFLVGRIGFELAVLSLVAVMVVVLTPLVLWLLVRGPEALGLGPDGDAPAPRASGQAAGGGAPPTRDFMRTCDGFGSYDAAFAGCLMLQLAAGAILLFGGARRSESATSMASA